MEESTTGHQGSLASNVARASHALLQAWDERSINADDFRKQLLEIVHGPLQARCGGRHLRRGCTIATRRRVWSLIQGLQQGNAKHRTRLSAMRLYGLERPHHGLNHASLRSLRLGTTSCGGSVGPPTSTTSIISLHVKRGRRS